MKKKFDSSEEERNVFGVFSKIKAGVWSVKPTTAVNVSERLRCPHYGFDLSFSCVDIKMHKLPEPSLITGLFHSEKATVRGTDWNIQ